MGRHQPSRYWQNDRLLSEMVLNRSRRNAAARPAQPPAGQVPSRPAAQNTGTPVPAPSGSSG